MLGVQIRRGANRVLRRLALSESVLALPAGRTVVRLLPPLTVTEEHADQVVESLTEVLSRG
jgi:acetylornithine/LysW-gamma-L-lysine aminotransferase